MRRLHLAVIPLLIPLIGQAETLRIGDYNIDCSDQGNNNAVSGPNAGIPAVIQAMGQHHLAGNAQPVDVMALTELLDTNNNSITSSTLPALVNSLNAIYGSGVYAYATTPDPTSGGTQFNGPSGLIFNTQTVQLISAKSLLYSGNSGNSNPRAPMRYELQPVGYGSNADFYIYVSHMKSGETSSDKSERGQEATIIRNDEATLPSAASASVIYTGDYNSAPPEAEFTNLTAAGAGQAFDPLNFTTSKQYFSESTDDLEYRDDYEMMTSNVLNDTGPLDYVGGSFQVFGNNGTTPQYGNTDSVGNTSLSDLSNASTILKDLTQPYGSDHMPAVADYQIGVSPLPVYLTWNNSGATGDGATWDVATNQNWNNGNPALFNQNNNVTFNDSNNGHYSVTLNASVQPASVTFSNNAGNYMLSGSGGIGGTASFSVTGSGTVTISTTNTYSGPTTVTGGTLIIAAAAALPSASSVTIGNGTLMNGSPATLQLAPGIGKSTVAALTINTGGMLDMTNNSMVINYGSAANDPVATICADLAAAYAARYAGSNLPITSSTAAANSGKFAIGYTDNTATNQLTLAVTVPGDTDLSGSTDFNDLTTVAQFFGQSIAKGNNVSWQTGDVNYDGAVDFNDLTIVAQYFGDSLTKAEAASLPASFVAQFNLARAEIGGETSSVPEPASIGLLAVGCVRLLSRRQRRG